MGLKPVSRKKRLFLKGLLLFVFVLVVFNVSFSFFGSGGSSCGGGILNQTCAAWGMDTAAAAFGMAINTLLAGVLAFCAGLMHAAGYVFDFIIKPESFTSLMNNPSLYRSWGIVRDLLNIAFILFLLFSAFATIFQVEKYSIKKILLMLVIMALLVNFSFPISRFIIDLANVPMYYLLNMTFPGDNTSSAASILEITGIGKFVTQSGGTEKILMSIVFTFLMAMTMVVIAIMFVIRMAMLAILVIFSSVGFIAAAFPATKKFADMWWSNLFKYAFFGPIMIFMLFISTGFVKGVLGDDTIQAAMNSSANSNAPGPEHADFLSDVMNLTLPIILLWAGMIVANKMSIAGAGIAVKAAKGAGMKLSGANWAKRQYDGFSTARKERQTARNKNNLGARLGRGVGTVTDAVHGGSYVIPGSKSARKRFAKRGQGERKKRVKDKAEDLKDSKVAIKVTVGDAGGGVDPSTGDVNKKVTEFQAANAEAFTNRYSDDKTGFVETELNSTSGGTSLNNFISGPLSAALSASLTAVRAGGHSEKELRQVTTHINRKMEEVANKYVIG